MPSFNEKKFNQSELVSDRSGSDEPVGEQAPSPGILDGMPDEMRSKLPDEIVDDLLAGRW